MKLPARSGILRDFQNQEYRFKIPNSRTPLAEKREGEEELRQLQSIMHFTQTQYANAV